MEFVVRLAMERYTSFAQFIENPKILRMSYHT